MSTVIAIFNVDDENKDIQEFGFQSEIRWCEESGIVLDEYTDDPELVGKIKELIDKYYNRV